ncbi:hypothetical protein GGF37_002073 [Kickxella alabastrina]|nr:hypothetical protein GGF37_002073 [Kickxella alabastrina]
MATLTNRILCGAALGMNGMITDDCKSRRSVPITLDYARRKSEPYISATNLIEDSAGYVFQHDIRSKYWMLTQCLQPCRNGIVGIIESVDIVGSLQNFHGRMVQQSNALECNIKLGPKAFIAASGDYCEFTSVELPGPQPTSPRKTNEQQTEICGFGRFHDRWHAQSSDMDLSLLPSGDGMSSNISASKHM